MKSIGKTTVREVKHSFGRFFAILAIIALGVGFFGGVRITTPAMIKMMNGYYSDNNFYDHRLISSLGWDKESVGYFSQLPDVRSAEGAVTADVLFINGQNEPVMKIHTLPDKINGIQLKEGRLPERPDECIADASTNIRTGDILKVSPENNEDTTEMLNFTELKVVGKAASSLYINFERGTTSLGNGSLTGFLYVTPDAFDTDYFTEIWVRFDQDFTIYSDEYKDYIKAREDQWEDYARKQADIRYNRIVTEAEEELDDGRRELEEKRSEGQTELDDARKELDDADKELKDAAKELEDGEKELADGQAELDKAKKELEDGQKELDKAKTQLEDSEKQLKDAENKLRETEEQLRSGQAQLDSARQELDAREAQLKAAAEALPVQEAAFYAKYAEALSMIDKLPEEVSGPILAAKAQIEAGKVQTETGLQQIAAARQELEAKQAEINSGREQYEAGKREYEAGKAEYEKGIAEYNDGLKKAEEGKQKYEDGVRELEEARQKLEDGKKEYEDGLNEYNDGLKEYKDGIKEFDEKISDAEKELAEAEDDIDGISKPDVWVLGRNTNIGYACFENDSQIVSQVARVFPVFFILVAALVCMTTMTRMVEEQRTQIGVLKALGYSNAAVMGKFIFYSGTAAVLGCIIGYAAGTWLFPFVIWNTYKLMYLPLDIHYMFGWQLAAAAGAAALLCSIGTTFIACRYELGETAANLMRPKSPKAGKRVLLEHIPFVWNRLKFLHKVSVRNIFRYKGRFFMMILGIGGCTALLLTGFGLNDSVAGFADVQYGEIQTSDASVSFKSEKYKAMDELLNDIHVKYMLLSESAWDLVYDNGIKSVTLEAVEDFSGIDSFMHFHTPEGTPLLPPARGEALVCNSISKRYGVKTGDTITLRDPDMRELTLTVSGVFENHVYNYIFISSDTIESQLSEAPELNTAYVNFAEDMDIYRMSAGISKKSYVTSVTIYQDLRTRMAKMMNSLSYIVLLVISCAAGLAFIVIYNLTNINITERVREIATIKVLGFFRRETSAYVLRENLFLTSIGILAGLGLGVLLHRFVMAQIIVDMVDFKVRILPLSFLWSILLTFLFNFIVNLFMELKLEKINMAESLKSVD